MASDAYLTQMMYLKDRIEGLEKIVRSINSVEPVMGSLGYSTIEEDRKDEGKSVEGS